MTDTPCVARLIDALRGREIIAYLELRMDDAATLRARIERLEGTQHD